MVGNRKRVAWSIAGLSALLIGAGTLLGAWAIFRGGWHVSLLSHQLTIPLSGIVFTVMGALVLARHPHQPIAWILSGLGLLSGVEVLNLGFLAYTSLQAPGQIIPAPNLAHWVAQWIFIPRFMIPLTLLLLFFPDGELASRHRRALAWATVVAIVLSTVTIAFSPGEWEALGGIVRNPFAVKSPFLDSAWLVANGLLALVWLACPAALFVRFRRAEGIERQQLKWLVYTLAVVFLVFFLTVLPVASILETRSAVELVFSAVNLATIAIAVAVSTAALRYRLYDIDLIINRTLVYGALTALVVGLYVLIVGATGVALQTNSNIAALLLTALVALALLRPAQGRIQEGVNRLLGAGTEPALALAGAPPPMSQEPILPAPRQLPRERPRLSRGWLIARRGWIVAAAMALLVQVLAIPGYLLRRPMGDLSGHLVYAPTPLMVLLNRANLAAAFLVALLSLALATLLFKKRPHDRMALLLAYYLLAHAILFSGSIEMVEYLWPHVAAFNAYVLSPGILAPLAAALLALFPDGRFVPSWTRWGVVATLLLAPAFYPLVTGRLAAFLTWTGIACWLAVMLAMVYAQVFRYRHVSTRQQRQQSKWVLFGFFLSISLAGLSTIPWSMAQALPAGTAMPWWVPLMETVWILDSAIIPISLTLAVMRYRLYDIDLIINRTLVYGALTLGTMTFYVILVSFLGNQVGRGDRSLIAFLATGLVAVLFQPLRQRLQRAVNHFMYGERDEPFDVLARLGKRLESTLAPEMVYPTIVETVAHTLKLPYVAIAVKRGEQFEIAEAYGSRNREPLAYPLTHQGELIGRLLVGRRNGEESFSAADERLLRSIARQAETAIHAVRLTADLQRSRQQLVTAREEERLRLRRDLHDGLGPALASVAWQAESARDLVYTDPDEAVQLLQGSVDQARDALVDIRRLVHGLRPPALDELGLVGALEQAARRHLQITVTVEASASLPSLPAAVEVAAYRIVQEALKNAVTHGKAKSCLVRLAVVDDSLHLTIADDGRGIPDIVTPGVGLVSMRERAEELRGSVAVRPRPGGGTEVAVTLPLK